MVKTDPSFATPAQNYSLAYSDDSDEGGLDFGQVLEAVRRRILVIVGMTVIVAAAAVYKAATDTPIYKAEFEILTQPVTIETQVLSATNPQTLSGQEEIIAVEADAVKLKLLKSPIVIDPVVTELAKKYPGITYGAVVSGLSIAPSEINLLTVGYKSHSQQLVIDTLTQLQEAYLRYSLESRQADIRTGINFVEEQLPQLRSRVQDQQDRLQQLRQKYNLVNPDSEGESLSTQISGVEQQRLDTQLQLNEARALYTNFQQELATTPAEFVASSVLTLSPRYQELLTQLRGIDNQIAKESVLYLEKSPELETLQEQRQKLLPLLNQESERAAQDLASRIRDLEARSQILDNTTQDLNQRVKQLSVISREYTDIQRELQIAANNLDQFLAKREAFKIDAAQRETPWQLLTPAGKPKPSSASAKKNFVLGSVLGLMLGLGTALLLDKLSNTLYSPKEVKEVTRLPLLGIIPLNKHLEDSSLIENQLANLYSDEISLELFGHGKAALSFSPVFYEAFRSLYTSIRLISPDAPIRSIVISSPTPREGKSTVAIYLAQASADQGRRVLLVDSDLRHPSIHQRMGLVNAQGLTDVILADADFNHVIQQSPKDNNLFILTTGSPPPDPVRILASQKMSSLMEQLESSFDLVIYDTSPILGLSDAYLLGAETDGLILVTGLGQLKRSVLENVMNDLRQHSNFRVPVLGVIANRDQNAAQSLHNYSYYQQSSSPIVAQQNGLVTTQAKPTKSFLNLFHKKSK
ncbi:MAG: GumC family protein [Microcoleaceae cyanobacterium]